MEYELNKKIDPASEKILRIPEIKENRPLPAHVIENRDEALDLAREIYQFLDQKKAEHMKLLYLEGVNPYFRFFLIATANSSLQLKSFVRDIKKNFGDRLPEKTSGYRPEDLDSGWVILDFIDLVVHVFLPEQREFYNLERLWGDAQVVDVHS